MRLWIFTVLLAACQAPPLPPQEFDGQAALRYVETQVGFGPRIPGTSGHRAMGLWLDSLLRTRADEVVIQDWEHQTAEGKTLPMRNLIARFRPELTERILYLAHWDTRPRSDAAGVADTTVPVPGANDGGSGVAVLLGVADALKLSPPDIGVDLLFVDGEDYGHFPATDVLIGSTYYAANPVPGPRPRFAVLFDMVGDASPRFPKEGWSVIAAGSVVDRVWEIAAELGHAAIFVPQVGMEITDDHLPLQRAGFQAIDIIDLDYPYWHTPDDTPDKVSSATLQIVGDVAMAVIRREAPSPR